MNEWMQKLLESKRAMRQNLSTLSFTEKIKILERLRHRSLVTAASPLGRKYHKRRFSIYSIL
jgi:hypothetical protein